MPGSETNVRAHAAQSLARVLDGTESIEAAVERLRSTVSDRDLRLFRQLLSGSVRWLMFLDSVIGRCASRPLERIDPGLLGHLRVAVYQILFLDRVPARAAVHQAVEAVKRASGTGGAGFANAVLRTVARHPELERWRVDSGDAVRDLALNQSHPENLLRGWIEAYGWDRTHQMVQANNSPRSALGVMSGDRSRLASVLVAAGADVAESEVSPLGLLVAGMAPADIARRGGYIQDSAHQAAALVPWPRRGESIFDAAAAPGGKTLALAAAESTARIVAADLRLDRLPRLWANLGGFGDRVHLLAADVRRPALRSGFDRVLFDAPCSGTGTLRKHPELKWRIDRDEIGRLVTRQLAGLRALAPLVRAGGLLCYITCSVETEENEGVVGAFLASMPGWREQEVRPTFGRDQWMATRPAGTRAAGLGWRILPGDDHDGATVHVLTRD